MSLNKYFSKSQAGQDSWVSDTLNNKQKGFFVDIGAHDGVFISNTHMLEKYLGWNGICIEADPNRFDSLCHNRSSINVPLAVRNYKGFCYFIKEGPDGHVVANINKGDIPCDTLHNILVEHGAPCHIDYISLDIEGLEVEVLESFPFIKWDVNLWTIEHNLFQDGPANKEKIFEIMSANGYQRVIDNACAGGNPNYPFEDWYKKI